MPDIYRIDQALFGYRNGHHLLATSSNIVPRELERLLVLSDIAPNAPFSGAEGYWTGSPLPDSGRYALIRTWPAAEMPRPGCVWSHVLILSTALIEKAWDIKSLANMFVRPDLEEGLARYQRDLAILQPEPALDSSSDSTFGSVLRAVYGEQQGSLRITSMASVGEALLSAWSQQWPELRSVFRFRTLPRTGASRSSVLQFDYMLNESDKRIGGAASKQWSWTLLAEKDASDIQPSTFRRYYREFGSLLPPKLASFALLGQAFVLKSQSDKASIGDLIAAVFEVYTGDSEAERFKHHLVSFDPVYIGLLGEASAIATIREFLALGQMSTWNALSLQKRNIEFLWTHASDEMIDLIRSAHLVRNQYAQGFLASVATNSPKEFLERLARQPEIYLQLAQSHAELLSPTAIRTFSVEVLRGLIASLKDRTDEARMLCRALSEIQVPAYIVEALFRQVPLIAVKHTANVLSRTFRQEPSNTLWLEVASGLAPTALRHEVLEDFEKSSELAAFAELLDYLSVDVIAVGPLPWARALTRVEDDVEGSPKATFQAFVLALALKRPERGTVQLFRYSFEALHRSLWESTLNHQASVLIEPALPHPRWFWQSWDVCLRLRRGVMRAFIDGHIPPPELLSLTKDTALLGMLLEAIDDGRNEDQSFREAVLRAASEMFDHHQQANELV